MATTITVRLFAAAKAAVGAGELALPAPATLAETLERAATAAADPGQARRVFARCTFLVDGIATDQTETPLATGAALDVLPPFSGG